MFVLSVFVVDVYIYTCTCCIYFVSHTYMWYRGTACTCKTLCNQIFQMEKEEVIKAVADELAKSSTTCMYVLLPFFYFRFLARENVSDIQIMLVEIIRTCI